VPIPPTKPHRLDVSEDPPCGITSLRHKKGGKTGIFMCYLKFTLIKSYSVYTAEVLKDSTQLLSQGRVI